MAWLIHYNDQTVKEIILSLKDNYQPDILRTGQRIDWSGSLYSPLALSDSLKLTNKAECQITRKISSYRTPSLLN